MTVISLDKNALCSGGARAESARQVASPALVWGLASVVALSRLLFGAQYLYHWDSVNFAFALLRYDVRAGQPHSPGYILYVALAWLVQALVGDANRAMILISAVASGLLVVALWRLAERLFPAPGGAGPVAGLLVAGNPLFWFYGSVALPHVLDAVITSSIALMGWRIRHGERRLLAPSALLLGIAGGIRQQDLLFLLPLWLFCVRGEGGKRIRGALVGTGLVCVAWFGPMVALSGGLAAYRHTVDAYTHTFFDSTSVLHGAGFAGVAHNLGKLVPYTLYAAIFAAVGLLFTCARWRPQVRERLGGERGAFLLLWAAPSLVFYTLVHMGQHGLIFTFLPPLLLACAGLLAAAGRAGRAAGAVAAVLGALFFVAAPEHLLPHQRLKVLSAATLRNHDQALSDTLALIRRRFPARETVIIAGNFRHLSYYLPEYRVVRPGYWSADGSANGPIYTLWQWHRNRDISLAKLPLSPRYLVLLGVQPRLRIDSRVEVRQLGVDRYVVVLPESARVIWSADTQALMVSRL
jgi:hypothetical protein